MSKLYVSSTPTLLNCDMVAPLTYCEQQSILNDPDAAYNAPIYVVPSGAVHPTQNLQLENELTTGFANVYLAAN